MLNTASHYEKVFCAGFGPLAIMCLRHFLITVFSFVLLSVPASADIIEIVEDAMPSNPKPLNAEETVNLMFQGHDSELVVDLRKQVLLEHLKRYEREQELERLNSRELRANLQREVRALRSLKETQQEGVEGGVYRDQYHRQTGRELLKIVHAIDLHVGLILMSESWGEYRNRVRNTGIARRVGQSTFLAGLFSPLGYAVYKVSLLSGVPLVDAFLYTAGATVATLPFGMAAAIGGGMVASGGSKRILDVPVRAVNAIRRTWTLFRRPRIDCANLLESGKR